MIPFRSGRSSASASQSSSNHLPLTSSCLLLAPKFAYWSRFMSDLFYDSSPRSFCAGRSPLEIPHSFELLSSRPVAFLPHATGNCLGLMLFLQFLIHCFLLHRQKGCLAQP